ncbi:thioesterase family protein [Pandoraea bronchicola]|uniref:Thioesterase n=1 Tax=Pandoraea bronchicola TaxID=2508287 RepID=A0A5E5BN31_9BURK|nr:thioesterase family protein [Pandoraea bronchicola]VVE86522.1 thioesterase [Pandoraea bronchicola]
MPSPELVPGLTFEWTYRVPKKAVVPELYDDVELCRDMPAVLATGYLAGILECACLQAIRPYLDWPREQSLGTLVSFSHLAATPAGDTLRIQGKLVDVAGRTLRFEVEAWDGLEKVSAGTHERVIVDEARFHGKLREKAAKLGLSL